MPAVPGSRYAPSLISRANKHHRVVVVSKISCSVLGMRPDMVVRTRRVDVQ